jgi:two-component system, chemotaxis family, protein-glutamate methylesterase/glutaminase
MARENNTPSPIRVLVVDDSAVVREVMAAVLSQEEDMVVTTAADPLIAMQKMKQTRPHVILLDLEMPRMDGLTFLRKIMAEDPIPTLVCSGVAARGTGAALRALDEGAVGIVTKPKLGVRDFLHESALVLIEMVRSAAGAHVRWREPLLRPPMPTVGGVLPARLRHSTAVWQMVAIGASTGGTEALTEILSALPPDAPGIVIVQHMPELFTAAFANRLNDLCQIRVKEAADGDPILPGHAYIAPGNQHISLDRHGPHYAVRVSDGPLVSRHRPSVDVLFRSAAEAAGPDALGVILTGMGNDGALGLLEMRRSGARTIAQDEHSCVVFGMPKEAIKAGAADVVVPLAQIASLILNGWRSTNDRQSLSAR